MISYTLGAVESLFAKLIWKHEPLSSGELVKLCQQELCWKKSTTYTVLKKLCDKGLFCNENGMVRSVVDEEAYYAMQSERFLDETFGGSLPAFVAAFASRKSLSSSEAAALQQLIDDYTED